MNAATDGTWTADAATTADAGQTWLFPFPRQGISARRQLRLAVIAALKAANLAIGGKPVTVDSPGNWPYPQDKLPAICVRSSTDGKDSLTKGNTDYTTSVEIDVRAAVAATTAEAAQDAIEALWYAIEQTILQDYYTLELIQNVSRIESGIEIKADGQMQLAGVMGKFRFETFETFDITQAPGTTTPRSVAGPIVPLTEVTVDVTRQGSNPPYSSQPGDVGLTLTLPGD